MMMLVMMLDNMSNKMFDKVLKMLYEMQIPIYKMLAILS
jgi:hypothetical protein